MNTERRKAEKKKQKLYSRIHFKKSWIYFVSLKRV